MKFYYLLFVLLTLQFSVKAQSKYEHLSTEKIPKDLLANAVAVVRFDSSEYRLISPSKFSHIQKTALTILKPDGKKYGNIVEEYNNLVKIKELKATLIDARGKVISRAKEKDFFDVASYAFDVNFHSDSRTKS